MSRVDHLQAVAAAISGHRLPLEDEKATQAAIGHALGEAGFTFDREVAISGGVIDFVVTCMEPSSPPLRSMRFVHIGVEVKLKGGARAIERQVARYAAEQGLDGVLLATARPLSLPFAIAGKPVAVIDIGRAWL